MRWHEEVKKQNKKTTISFDKALPDTMKRKCCIYNQGIKRQRKKEHFLTGEEGEAEREKKITEVEMEAELKINTLPLGLPGEARNQ